MFDNVFSLNIMSLHGVQDYVYFFIYTTYFLSSSISFYYNTNFSFNYNTHVKLLHFYRIQQSKYSYVIKL